MRLVALRSLLTLRLSAIEPAPILPTINRPRVEEGSGTAVRSVSREIAAKSPGVQNVSFRFTRPQRRKLMRLYIEQMPSQGRIVLAGDHTVWPRPEAVTRQERTVEHYCANGVPGNPPVAKGEDYSTIAWIPEAQGSWALPLRHERITRQGNSSRRSSSL